MSLDVYLLGIPIAATCPECGSPITWDNYLYEANITRNLAEMAEVAGIYKHLWRPEDIGITKASELIEPLENGLNLLRSDPARFKQYDAPNGWGVYDDLVMFVAGYLEACREYPGATVGVSR